MYEGRTWNLMDMDIPAKHLTHNFKNKRLVFHIYQKHDE